MDRSWENRRLWRQPRSRERIEKEEVGHHLVLDRDQELVPIEIGLGVLNVENMTTLQMNVLI